MLSGLTKPSPRRTNVATATQTKAKINEEADRELNPPRQLVFHQLNTDRAADPTTSNLVPLAIDRVEGHTLPRIH